MTFQGVRVCGTVVAIGTSVGDEALVSLLRCARPRAAGSQAPSTIINDDDDDDDDILSSSDGIRSITGGADDGILSSSDGIRSITGGSDDDILSSSCMTESGDPDLYAMAQLLSAPPPPPPPPPPHPLVSASDSAADAAQHR